MKKLILSIIWLLFSLSIVFAVDDNTLHKYGSMYWANQAIQINDLLI